MMIVMLATKLDSNHHGTVMPETKTKILVCNRKRVCEKPKYLDLEVDLSANETCEPDADISTPASKPRILVIATREDLTIMREARRLIPSSITQHSQARVGQPL
jgi:hypothetical protein